MKGSVLLLCNAKKCCGPSLPPHNNKPAYCLINQASATKKMSVALQCVTMNKILEPKSASDVLPVSKPEHWHETVAV